MGDETTNATATSEVTECTEEIIQILPAAADWVAVFQDADGTDMRPVLCLALVECSTHGDSSVAPMIADGDEVVMAASFDSYVGLRYYVADDDNGAPILRQ
ncbi:MAG: hypothetical protein JSV86_10470 [Gemmatimonadota bacterium]|nr:MAG: hypothetical protein JSV86_10470 [Gemmatimonadota bacterium]